MESYLSQEFDDDVSGILPCESFADSNVSGGDAVAASQAHGVSSFGFMAYVCISPSQVSWSHVIYTFDQREKYLLREGGQSRSQNDDYRSSTHVPREEDVRVVGL